MRLVRLSFGYTAIERTNGRYSMTARNKATNTVESAKGAAKVGVGRVKHDRSLKSEGRKQRAKSDLKQAGEKIKDAIKR